MLIFKKIFKKISHYPWIFVISGYLIISFIFNGNLFWKELIFDQAKIGAVYGEVQAYEWLTEKFYKTLISGNNPFGLSKAMLYPFGFNLGLVDAGYGLFFTLFRPFLSTHQTMSILIALSLFMANIGMYLLLRKLRFSIIISFIIGAAYGYMTFLMPRAGHLSYWCHFMFPWFYYCLISLLTNKNKFKKVFSSIGVASFFVLTLWLNFYYFVTLLISVFSLIGYFLILKSKIFFQQIKKLWKYFILTGLLTLFFLIPWLKALYELFIFDQVPKTQGWGGAIEFSSELFNYFIPSEYGHLVTKYPFLLKPFSLFLKLYTPNARLIFENFTYPGLIILICYGIFIIFYKKFDKNIKNKIGPFLFTSIVFFILTLGPFLHVFGHWVLTLDDGVPLVIPLPYIVLHYIPFLNNIRVPGRLVVGFIFFAYIVSAYIINHLLNKQSNKIRNFVFIILLIVFFADHRYYVNPNIIPGKKYPEKIFNTIKKDPQFTTVLEIPFTVRDGFTYFGNGDAFQMIIGETIHGKPVLGGYTGRIADYKKDYYMKNPFLGYLGRVIDENLLVNPTIDKENLINWERIDLEKSKRTIDFLDIKYLINNDEKLYSSSLSAVYQDLGYEKKLIDDKYSLWEKKLDRNEYKSIQTDNPFDKLFLGFGWYDLGNNFRWANRRSSVMFKIQKPEKYSLHFEAAAFYKDQSVTVYLNKKKIAKINISTEMKEYSVPVATKFETGINTIYFIFNKYYLPSKVIPGSLDQRRLSGKFSKIWLVNQQ